MGYPRVVNPVLLRMRTAEPDAAMTVLLYENAAEPLQQSQDRIQAISLPAD